MKTPEKTQDRSVEVKMPFGDYVFSEDKHLHMLNGKSLTGVTTALKVIGKGDVLVQWSANQAIEYIKQNAIEIDNDEGFFYGATSELLEEAKKAWRGSRDKAGGFGTNVHNAIELWIKKEPIPELDVMEQKAFNNFTTWAVENKIEFLESERHVASKEMWIGGILDLVFKKDDKIYIGDIKTSSGIYPEYFFQMGAYNLCLEEMGLYPEIDGYTIINLKKNGQIEVETNYGKDQNKEAFKSALKLYRILEETKKTI